MKKTPHPVISLQRGRETDESLRWNIKTGLYDCDLKKHTKHMMHMKANVIKETTPSSL